MTNEPESLPQEGLTFSLSMEVEEDIEKETEDFVRFKRRGEYEQAHKMFQECLSKHLSFFPIVAEYADLLWEQGRYLKLSEFLDIQLEYMEGEFEEEEMELLRIMRCLVRIHTNGALRPALKQAAKTWDFLCHRGKMMSFGDLPSDVEIHIFEIYINIIVFALATSNWVSIDDLKCPWDVRGTSECCGFVRWYETLSEIGQLWDASRVLIILLTILPRLLLQDVTVLLKSHCFADIWIEGSAPNLSEIDQLIAMTTSMSRAKALADLTLLARRDGLDFHSCMYVYDIACSYYRIRSYWSQNMFNGNVINLHSLRVKVQNISFRGVYNLLLMGPRAYTIRGEPPKEMINKDLLRQDPQSYVTFHVESLLDSLLERPDLRDWELTFESLMNLQLRDQGDSIGFIRTCDIYCAVACSLKNGDAPFVKALLSPEIYSFLQFRGPAKGFVDLGNQEMTELLFPKLYNAMHEAVSEELDIPLYKWAIYCNLEKLDISSLPKDSGAKDASTKDREEGLPVPITVEDLVPLIFHVRELYRKH